MNINLDLIKFASEIASAKDREPLYCLADHAGMPGLHRQLIRTQCTWRSLFEGSKEEGALAVAPLLFEINSRLPGQRGLLRWLSEHGTYESCLIFVASPLPIDQLASRLSQRLNARISEDADVLLRFHDPRVFEQLLEVLSVSQKQDFLSCATTWWFIDRRGQINEVTAEFQPVEPFRTPQCLTASQEFALLDGSECDQIIEQLKGAIRDLDVALPPPQRYEFIARHVAAARKLKISATYELSLYCAVAIEVGDDFANFPMWNAILAKVHDQQIIFADAVEEMDA